MIGSYNNIKANLAAIAAENGNNIIVFNIFLSFPFYNDNVQKSIGNDCFDRTKMRGVYL